MSACHFLSTVNSYANISVYGKHVYLKIKLINTMIIILRYYEVEEFSMYNGMVCYVCPEVTQLIRCTSSGESVII